MPNTINNTKSLNNSVTCSTAAGTAAKTVSLSGFTLVKGAKLIINLQNANTAQSALTLNVNSTGAKTIVWDGKVTSSTNYAMPTGYYNCYYDGTYWFMESYYESHNARVSGRAVSADSSGYATTSLKTTVRETKTCSTGASTVTKIVSVNGYTLSTRDELLIYFSTANTASNPTLNVDSTGAKPIKVFGTSPNSTNKLLKVGTYYCQYDGTNWNCYPYGVTNEISADNMHSVTSDAVYNALQSTFQGELDGQKSATSSTFKAMGITTCGKVKTFKIRVTNLSNSNVGTINQVYVGSIALYPKSVSYAIGADVTHSGAVCQARLESSGALYISESMGILNGNNYIEIPFTIITD